MVLRLSFNVYKRGLDVYVSFKHLSSKKMHSIIVFQVLQDFKNRVFIKVHQKERKFQSFISAGKVLTLTAVHCCTNKNYRMLREHANKMINDSVRMNALITMMHTMVWYIIGCNFFSVLHPAPHFSALRGTEVWNAVFVNCLLSGLFFVGKNKCNLAISFSFFFMK